MYAVISAGGKQIKVAQGDIIQVERQNAKPGDSIVFSEVLMLADGDDLRLGTPRVEEANVFGTVLDLLRSPKILIFKKKRRKQYRRTRGHRQTVMRVRIDELGLYSERRSTAENRVAAAPVQAQIERPAKVEKPARPAGKGKKGVPKKAPAVRKSARADKTVARGAKGAAAKKESAKVQTPRSKGKKR
ncbi:MAG: 50S ribosomal protein L21 [Acidobacteria bacterium]|nr:50S ribosomal protein L21 [Acidobacteriota bacterium]